ncbi:hypothetical protein M0805_009629 [Coniferiporia weirii]|nr:hypothetical protein M0805_009629 [Coniferiporia weirii]
MSASCTVEGLQLTRVKVIFTLPFRFSAVPERLAYIEWFRPFRGKDADSGLHVLSWTRQGGTHQAKVIPLDDIEQSVHLVPKFGREIDPSWNQWTVFNECQSFFMNSYINMHTFLLFRPIHI